MAETGSTNDEPTAGPDLDDEAPARASRAKREPKGSGIGPAAAQLHIGLRLALGLAGLCLLVGFFLPWLSLREIGVDTGETVEVSGIALVVADSATYRQVMDPGQRYLVLLVPIFGLALTAIGFLGFRFAGPVGFGMGLLLIIYGLVRVIIVFLQTARVGLWLVLLGAFTALVAGLIAYIRSRELRLKRRRARPGKGGGDPGPAEDAEAAAA
ncbi:MAG: hypothetical protein ACFCGT_17055 [Sandaracinaceae bacterium]